MQFQNLRLTVCEHRLAESLSWPTFRTVMVCRCQTTTGFQWPNTPSRDKHCRRTHHFKACLKLERSACETRVSNYDLGAS